MHNILIVYAVKEEYVELHHADFNFIYCQTGVGKVNAALAVNEAIRLFNPFLVINLATAGSVNHPVGSVHLCAKFVDRDMEKLFDFGVVAVEDFTTDVAILEIVGNSIPLSVCNTGDAFLTNLDGCGDVFDMEAFAIAKACRLTSVPFVSVKYVTDKIGENSVADWYEKLTDARGGLLNYMVNQLLPVIAKSKYRAFLN